MNLSCNRIGEKDNVDGAKALAEGLIHNGQLEHLVSLCESLCKRGFSGPEPQRVLRRGPGPAGACGREQQEAQLAAALSQPLAGLRSGSEAVISRLIFMDFTCFLGDVQEISFFFGSARAFGLGVNPPPTSSTRSSTGERKAHLFQAFLKRRSAKTSLHPLN